MCFFLSRFAKRHETGARTSCSAHAHSVVDRFSYRLAHAKSVVTEFACTDLMVCACRSCRRQISVLSCACGFCRRQKLIPPKRPLLHRLSTNQNSLSRARPFCRFQHTFSVEKRQIRTTVSQHTAHRSHSIYHLSQGGKLVTENHWGNWQHHGTQKQIKL